MGYATLNPPEGTTCNLPVRPLGLASRTENGQAVLLTKCSSFSSLSCCQTAKLPPLKFWFLSCQTRKKQKSQDRQHM